MSLVLWMFSCSLIQEGRPEVGSPSMRGSGLSEIKLSGQGRKSGEQMTVNYAILMEWGTKRIIPVLLNKDDPGVG